jgi:DnaJ-class molecular chaperone
MQTYSDDQISKTIAADYRVVITSAEATLGTRRIVHFYGADGRERTVAIDIPAGVTTGTRVQMMLPEQAGEIGLVYGAIEASITVLPHLRSECRGSDVYMVLQADRATAERDGEVRVPLEDGRVLAAPIRPGITHDRFVYFGQGLPRGSAPLRRGDLILNLELVDVEHPAAREAAPEPVMELQRPWWRSLLRMA